MPTPAVETLESFPSYLVISGGTGCNEVCAAFGSNTCYVLPISDNGGSSAEIIRVLGGPSIGDIRSRLIRLMPDVSIGSPLYNIRKLLSYRFPPSLSDKDSRDSWRELVEGRSQLWSGIPSDRKEVIRGFLVYFESEILRRAHKNFMFRNGSVGNFFLAGAQQFFGSLPSAIYMFSSITCSEASILPVILTNHTCTLAARLLNGSEIVGQCEISHPIPAASDIRNESSVVWDESAVQSVQTNLSFSKDHGSGSFVSLPSPIDTIYYINAHGQEIFPPPNPDFIKAISKYDVLIYSCGSLWTSILPCIALQGVGAAIANSSTLKAKVLLLNSAVDRETENYTAVDFIRAITNMLCRRELQMLEETVPPSISQQRFSTFVTHIVFLTSSDIVVDEIAINEMGIKCYRMSGRVFDATITEEALKLILRDI